MVVHLTNANHRSCVSLVEELRYVIGGMTKRVLESGRQDDDTPTLDELMLVATKLDELKTRLEARE